MEFLDGQAKATIAWFNEYDVKKHIEPLIAEAQCAFCLLFCYLWTITPKNERILLEFYPNFLWNWYTLHKCTINHFYNQCFTKQSHRFSYLFSFSFLYKQTLKKELSKVLNIDIENEYFSDSYEKAITILLNEEKISISENEQLSIYKKK